jgi:dTMP kinase
VRAINGFATGGRTPDRTLLLEVDPTIGRDRSRTRGEELDRLELESHEFFDRISDAYSELAEQDPERVRSIDASRPAAEVLESALEAISDLV